MAERDTHVRILIREGDVPFEKAAGKVGIGVDLEVDGVKAAPTTCLDGGHCSQPAVVQADVAALLYLASAP